MGTLGNGLYSAGRHEEEISVREAELSTLRRLGRSDEPTLVVMGNLANTYDEMGRKKEAMQLKRDVYSERLKLNGVEYERTLIAASNYAASLRDLKRFEEIKSLMRKTIPVARRVLGGNHELTLKMRCIYARALYEDPGATLDDLREAVTTLEEIERTARRVLGGTHPITVDMAGDLRHARAVLRARETPSPPASA